MYCVKCGVRLQDGTDRCPLCGTPVWNPDSIKKINKYPERLPQNYRESSMPFALVTTVLCIIAILVLLAVCLNLYGQLAWGGYAIFGILLFYVLFILPMWFLQPLAEVMIPVDHIAIGLYLLFVNIKTGGHWFLSFAFPIVMISCVLLTIAAVFIKHIKKGRLFAFGGLFILMGCLTMLVELFQHITFKTQMFRWSLYSLAGFAVVGIFLIIVGLIPSLKNEMERRFFF